MDISTRTARIHVREQGQGELALVFLHYWGGSSRTWTEVGEALSDAYRIVATDHRGWGDSSAPEHGYALADIVLAVIEALALEDYILVGHSMGGKVAQLLAARRPAGLRGVVLVAPSPPTATILPQEQLTTMLGAYDSRESVEWVLDNVLTARRLTPAQRERVLADSLRSAPQARAAWPAAAMLEDITVEAAAIEVPVLVMSGELDPIDPPERLRETLLPHVPGAQLQVLAGVGHLPPLEAPSAVATAIRQFVGTLAPSDADAGADAARCLTPEQVPLAFDAAFNAGDVERVLALFSDDATMRMADGETVASGQAALRQQFTGFLSAGPRIHNRPRRTLISGDLALVLLDWTVTMPLPDGQRAESHGTATQVMQRDARGGWKLRISNPLGVL